MRAMIASVMITICLLSSCSPDSDINQLLSTNAKQEEEIDRLKNLVLQLEENNGELSDKLKQYERGAQDYSNEQAEGFEIDKYPSLAGLYRLGEGDSERGMRVLDLEKFLAFQEVTISENGLSIENLSRSQIEYVSKGKLNEKIMLGFESYRFDEPFYPDSIYHEIRVQADGITNWYVGRGFEQLSEIPFQRISEDSFALPVPFDNQDQLEEISGLYAFSKDTQDYGMQVFSYQEGLIFQRVKLDRPTESEYMDLSSKNMIPATYSSPSRTGVYEFDWQISPFGYDNGTTAWYESYELEVYDGGMFGIKYVDEYRDMPMRVDLIKISSDPFNVPQ